MFEESRWRCVFRGDGLKVTPSTSSPCHSRYAPKTGGALFIKRRIEGALERANRSSSLIRVKKRQRGFDVRRVQTFAKIGA